MSRKMPSLLTIAAILLGVLLVVAVTALVLTVDDWSRDLSTNHAATQAGGDPLLRPIETDLAPSAAGELVAAAAAGLPRWSPPRRSKADDVLEYHFVRSTALFGFKDDIAVRIRPSESGSRITAESQSRLGRGDLGQNPRNLKELFAAIRSQLKSQ